jgi:D-sedoheptulose 7-phosphate isomerase
MYKLKELYQNSISITEYIKGYQTRINDIIRNLDTESVVKAAEAIEKAGVEGKTIFVIGNGGSSAVASHFIEDFGPNSLVEDKPGFRMVSLTDNVASVTAIANDAGFENIFAHQLQANMHKGDILLAMSVSGNSENIIRGVKYAKEHSGYTIGFAGFEGGRIKEECDLCIHVPTTLDEYGPVEDVFSILGHIISGYLTMKRGRFLHH